MITTAELPKYHEKACRDMVRRSIAGCFMYVVLWGVIVGVGLLYGLLFVSQPLIITRFGLFIAIGGLSTYELIMIGVVCLAGCLIGMIPGYQIYRYSLADGMTIRI